MRYNIGLPSPPRYGPYNHRTNASFSAPRITWKVLLAQDANLSIAADPSTGAGRWLASGTPLPADLAQQATVRVRTAAWIFAGTWLLVLVMNEWLFAGAGAEGIVWSARQTVLTLTGLAASLAMVVMSMRLRSRPELLIEIALGFQVVISLIVSLITEYYPRQDPHAISWVCIPILTLPTIAPASPRKTLLASLLAAATVPLALMYSRSIHPAYDPPVSVMLWLTIPPFICAILAVIPATVIRGLGKQVKRAREVGSYQLDEKLASGGMGDVYRATHRLLARPAAVKVISPAVLSADNTGASRALERFRREASAAATLTSPHTIDLYDYGVSDQGIFYYVMELLDGIDLQDLVAKHGPLPAERAVHLMKQACDSLGEAHAVGLIHRDVKPSNILACRMGLSVDYVKVLDFGLVRKDPARAEYETHITSAGSVSGTPAFMAPESVTGEGTVSPASDVYALGCVMHWLLAGQTVFKAANPTMMMLQHIQNAPMPPSARSKEPVPRELDEIVLRCLAKDPAERPRDGMALLEILSRVRLPAPWTDERAKEWWSRHRAPAEMRNSHFS